MSQHYFPGGNTPDGFFSYFGNIPFHGERTICLKGASGCGKSTFMRKTAAAFEARGFAVEYFHCSNDPKSLDGVCVPGASLCIVDATAPHVQDPAVPVAHDEIFNMAAFIDPSTVAQHKDELSGLARQKKQHYEAAYGYLAAARAVYQNNSRLYARFLDRAKLNAAALEALSLLEGSNQPGRAGRSRGLFAEALTPDGFVHTLDSLTDQHMIVVLHGEPGMGADEVLEQLRRAANLRGFDCLRLCCPLDPGRPEHLIIPALGLGFFTKSRLWAAAFPAHARVIDFADFLGEGIEKHREEIAYNDAMFDELSGRAVRTLAAQRKLHDRAEEIYIAGMDFEGLNRACDEIIARELAAAAPP
ncbi:MAG: ATPase [Firmicutes bacterium]|nr:ATPase [Bacillota bacterium]